MSYNSSWFSQQDNNYSSQPRPVMAAPPRSQIPGLGDQSEYSSQPEPRKQWIKDSDSDYVRMAKQGGRSDLLNQDTTEEPSQNQRPDWLKDDDVNESALNEYINSREESQQYRDSRPNQQQIDFGAPRDSRQTYTDGYFRQESSSSGQRRHAPQPASLAPYAADYSEGRMQTESNSAFANRQQSEMNSNGSLYGKKYSPPSAAGSAAGDRNSYGQFPEYSNQNNNSQSRLSSGSHTDVTSNRFRANKPPDSDMSKLMSFGYLSEKGSNDEAVDGGRRRQQPVKANHFSQEDFSDSYDKIRNVSGDQPSRMTRQNSSSLSSLLPTDSDKSYGRCSRKEDDRPDFFRIGATASTKQSEPVNGRISSQPGLGQIGSAQIGSAQIGSAQLGPATYGRRKASMEERPDFFFGSSNKTQSTDYGYGKMKPDMGERPDFFKIGSGERPVNDISPPDDEIFDKLNSYQGSSQSASHRRRKMDFNGPILPNPVKAVSRY